MVDTVRRAGTPNASLRRVVVSAAPLLIAMIALLAVRDLGAHPIATLAALAAAIAAFVWSLARLGASDLPATAVLLVAMLARLLLLPVPPALSDDVYRYLWDGRIAAAGWNPYYHAPQDPALAPW